jgi:tetratricopeptide (TPR) repeat protein
MVEGMPLALELAAAWVRLLPCAQIVEQVASSLDFLAAPRRTGPNRHRSLRAVFDQSWRLLPDTEQAAITRLSVFHGTFDREAAQEVGGASLSVLASLADKSLLHADGTGRYGLHELLRHYAADHLAEQAIAADHRERAIDYLTRAAERASHASAQRQAAGFLGQAIAIAEEAGRSDLLGELHHKRGQALLQVNLCVEARPDLVAALAATRAEQLDEQVQIRLELGEVDFFLHDLASMWRHANEALAQAEAAERGDLVGAVLVKLGFVETNDGHLREAMRLYERALAQGGDAHPALGRTLYWLGRYPEAVAHLRLAVEATRGAPLKQIFPLQDLGLALTATGEYQEAIWAFGEAQRLSREHENWPLLARSVANLAGLHLNVFDYVGSVALAEEARTLARSADFVLAEISAGLDLLFNFARRSQVGRAEKLLPEVAEAVENARGSHGWLWRIRLAQARAELASARGEWEETRHLAEISLQESRALGRVKYQALALKTRAEALAALGCTSEALVDLRNALAVTRPTTDPALFVQMAAAFLVVEGDDALAQEAYATAQRLSAALPTDEMRHRFEAAEPVRHIARVLR